MVVAEVGVEVVGAGLRGKGNITKLNKADNIPLTLFALVHSHDSFLISSIS